MPWGNTGSVGNGKVTKKVNVSIQKRPDGKNIYAKEIAYKITKQVPFKKELKSEK